MNDADGTLAGVLCSQERILRDRSYKIPTPHQTEMVRKADALLTH